MRCEVMTRIKFCPAADGRDDSATPESGWPGRRLAQKLTRGIMTFESRGGTRMRLIALAALMMLAVTAASAGTNDAKKAPAAAPPSPAKPACANPNGLGVARTVEIDTTGGPGFGFEQYKAYDFLEDKEVVLTFDDGPQMTTTKAILDALQDHCTKATFFSIGKMALGMPEILRDVIKRGHTVGSHTMTHASIRKKKDQQEAINEIEKGLSAVKRAAGAPIAPFFRFPFLQDSPQSLTYLASRNIAVFSMDVDSFDFKFRNAEQMVKDTMAKLDKKGKGILLMHDIQPVTAKAMPGLLDALKAGGYRIVHVKAKEAAASLAEYDALIEKDVKGLPGAAADRPTASIVKTVPND
jgi:peptidoglycan/xylan/chitin deacetylase (PgdA/CDA1 family)